MVVWRSMTGAGLIQTVVMGLAVTSHLLHLPIVSSMMVNRVMDRMVVERILVDMDKSVVDRMLVDMLVAKQVCAGL